jgi:hypothetical protein
MNRKDIAKSLKDPKVFSQMLKNAENIHVNPIDIEKECIMLKDGTKINCSTQVLASDQCPHGVFLCGNKCPEGCKWIVKGEVVEF